MNEVDEKGFVCLEWLRQSNSHHEYWVVFYRRMNSMLTRHICAWLNIASRMKCIGILLVFTSNFLEYKKMQKKRKKRDEHNDKKRRIRLLTAPSIHQRWLHYSHVPWQAHDLAAQRAESTIMLNLCTNTVFATCGRNEKWIKISPPLCHFSNIQLINKCEMKEKPT